MTVLYGLPSWLLITSVTLLCVILACGGHVIVRRSYPLNDLIEHNEVAGFIITVVGVIYAVLLAFLTVVVWQHFDDAQSRADQEVDAATDVERFAARLDVPERVRVMGDLGHYVHTLVTKEWPGMRRGSNSVTAQILIVRLLDDVIGLRTNTYAEMNVQRELLDRVGTMADLRRERINDNSSGIPGVLWIALVVGASTVIGFIYLFGLKNFTAQLLMTAAVAIMIGVSLSVIIALDYPFRGDVSISSARWAALYDSIERGEYDR